MIPGGGYGFGRSLGAHGYGVGIGTPLPIQDHDGFDHEYKKKHHDAKLREDIEQAWQGLTGRKEALELVPATTIAPVDYILLDAERTKTLLKLYQWHLAEIDRDDEEILLLL